MLFLDLPPGLRHLQYHYPLKVVVAGLLAYPLRPCCYKMRYFVTPFGLVVTIHPRLRLLYHLPPHVFEVPVHIVAEWRRGEFAKRSVDFAPEYLCYTYKMDQGTEDFVLVPCIVDMIG